MFLELLDLLRKDRFPAPCLIPNKKWSLSCGFIYIFPNGCMPKGGLTHCAITF